MTDVLAHTPSRRRDCPAASSARAACGEGAGRCADVFVISLFVFTDTLGLPSGVPIQFPAPLSRASHPTTWSFCFLTWKMRLIVSKGVRYKDEMRRPLPSKFPPGLVISVRTSFLGSRHSPPRPKKTHPPLTRITPCSQDL